MVRQSLREVEDSFVVRFVCILESDGLVRNIAAQGTHNQIILNVYVAVVIPVMILSQLFPPNPGAALISVANLE